jgi:hypothetical protein
VKLLSVSCQHCGGPLEVPARVTQITCQFCGARLQVQRSGNAVFTETLDQLAQQTGRIADNTEYIRLQNELERLDREWMLEKERYMVRGKDGELSVPSKTASVVGAVIVVGFGLFWTIVAAGMTGAFFRMGGGGFGAIGGIFPCFGLVFIGLGIATSIHHFSKASDFELRQRQYHHARQRLLSEMQAFRQEA